MKNLFFICCLVISALLITSCQKEEITNKADQKLFNHEMIPNLLKSGSLIEYTQLCEEMVEGTLSSTSWAATAWDFYYFIGNEGDKITITVEGYNGYVSGNFFNGTAYTTNGIEWYDGGPDMTNIMHICYLNVPPVVQDGMKYTFDYTLPNTGKYTIGIMSEGGTKYKLQVEGITCDSDGDGCPDSEDAVVNSNMEEFVEIDGCLTGVPNRMTLGEPCGIMMSDMIDVLEAAEYRNKGQFVSQVAQLTESWFMDGLITLEEKDAIVACAAESSIGVK